MIQKTVQLVSLQVIRVLLLLEQREDFLPLALKVSRCIEVALHTRTDTHRHTHTHTHTHSEVETLCACVRDQYFSPFVENAVPHPCRSAWMRDRDCVCV